MRTIALVLALAACGDDDAPRRHRDPPPRVSAPASDAECAAAGQGALADSGAPDPEGELRTARAKVIEDDCKHDRWPSDVAHCLAVLGDALRFLDCRIPSDAETRLSHDLQDTMRIELGLPR